LLLTVHSSSPPIVDLQVGLQRVVVEDHRQPLLTRLEQDVAQVLVGAQPTPQLDGERRLGADADGEVARPVAGADLREARLQVVAQRLGHALAAGEHADPVALPGEADRVQAVAQVLGERRVGGDQVVEARPEVGQGVDDLVQVRAGVLHHGDPAIAAPVVVPVAQAPME